MADTACTSSLGGLPCVNFIEAVSPDGAGSVNATNFAVNVSAGSLGTEIWQFIGVVPSFVAGPISGTFNIWEDHVGGTISDKLSLSVVNSVVIATFQSDVEGVPMTPFVGATGNIVENGDIQYLNLTSLGLSGTVAIGFQSDKEPTVPEPGSVLLLLTMLTLTGGFFGAVKLRRT